MESLKIIHFKGTSEPPVTSWLHWKTCLRQIIIGFGEIPFSCGEAEVFEGEEAYGFFLEVVCGLHSPLIGETEVMGQFRELTERVDEVSSLYERSQLSQFFKSILTDAKYVRETALKFLGSRSYGSLLRRYLKETKGVSVIGAGKLACDIIPWLKDDVPVHVFCRREDVRKELQGQFDFAEFHLTTDSLSLDEMFIIAASMTHDEVFEFMKGRTQNLKRIIDLRDISTSDPIQFENLQTLTLTHFFDEIKKAEKEGLEKLSEARKLIEELKQKRFRASEIRPFGWEDLCG